MPRIKINNWISRVNNLSFCSIHSQMNLINSLKKLNSIGINFFKIHSQYSRNEFHTSILQYLQEIDHINSFSTIKAENLEKNPSINNNSQEMIINNRKIILDNNFLVIGNLKVMYDDKMFELLKLFNRQGSLYPSSSNIDTLRQTLNISEIEMTKTMRKLRNMIRDPKGEVIKNHALHVEEFIRNHPKLSPLEVFKQLSVHMKDISKTQLRGLVDYSFYKIRRKSIESKVKRKIEEIIEKHDFQLSKKLYSEIEIATFLPRSQIRRIVRNVIERTKTVPLSDESKQMIEEALFISTSPKQVVQLLKGKIPNSDQQIKVYICKYFTKYQLSPSEKKIIETYTRTHFHEGRKIICDLISKELPIPRIRIYDAVTLEIKKISRKEIPQEIKKKILQLLKTSEYSSILKLDKQKREEALQPISIELQIPLIHLSNIIHSYSESINRKSMTLLDQFAVQKALNENNGIISNQILINLMKETGLKRSQIRYLIQKLKK